MQVVSHPATHFVEFDASANDIATRQIPVHGGWQVLCFQHLNLQRHRQAIFGTAVAQSYKCFAAFEHGAGGQSLKTVEVGQSCGIRLLTPVPPEAVDGFAGGLVLHHALRLDAGADGVRNKGFDASSSPGVTPHQVTALGA